MRIRSIRPEFWRSASIARLSIEDRLLFIGLWSYVDDNGVGRDNAAIITAELFALDGEFSEDSLNPHDILSESSVSAHNILSAGTEEQRNRGKNSKNCSVWCCNSLFSAPVQQKLFNRNSCSRPRIRAESR